MAIIERTFWPSVLDVIKLFCRKSRFTCNLDIEKSLFWCLNLHKNVKTMLFKQNNTVKLFIAFKMAFSHCFSLTGNLDFPDFLQKSFITSTTGLRTCLQFFKLESMNQDIVFVISLFAFLTSRLQNKGLDKIFKLIIIQQILMQQPSREHFA